MLNEMQVRQICKVAPKFVFEMTGIEFKKVEYDYSAYDSWDGSNQIEKRYMDAFLYTKKGNTYRIGDLAAINMVINAINSHTYKNVIRQLNDKNASDDNNLDMIIPLEKYNSYNRYD